METPVEATERPLVVFSLDDQRYALALGCVQRAMRVVAITPLPKAPPIVRGIVDLGGVVIPVINIRQRFNHPPRSVRLSDHLIVAVTGKRTVALLVDETNGVIGASAESLAPAGEILPTLELFDGAMKLSSPAIRSCINRLSIDSPAAGPESACPSAPGRSRSGRCSSACRPGTQ